MDLYPMPEDVRWVRSYVLDDGDGAVRTLCIYEASSLEAIREHVSRAGLPAAKIVPVAETLSSGPARSELRRDFGR
jgi:hypothetical protein